MKLKPALTCAGLIGIGCLQMIGDVAGLPMVKAIGAISHASPAPKVFTAQEGFETYSPHFFVAAEQVDGSVTSVRLTPALNARVRGPYNRRNAYGAALSYGPVLVDNPETRPMFEAALRYAVCADDAVRADVALPQAASYQINIESRRPATRAWANEFRISCQTGEVAITGRAQVQKEQQS
ncbi:MAG: hypothetical protein NXH85_11830 [Pseudomonadaceae bacterium]|nr:hypothetical protein [Pseudomonadaceae bacterium]